MTIEVSKIMVGIDGSEESKRSRLLLLQVSINVAWKYCFRASNLCSLPCSSSKIRVEYRYSIGASVNHLL